MKSVSQGDSTELPNVFLIDEETSYGKDKKQNNAERKFVSDSKLREDIPSKKTSPAFQINLPERQISSKKMQLGATPFIPKSFSNKNKMDFPNLSPQKMKIASGISLEESQLLHGHQKIPSDSPSYRKMNEKNIPFPQYPPAYNQAYIPVVMQMIPMPVIPRPPVNVTPAQMSTGILKFFDDAKNYGFFVVDDDGSDLFVHYDDLLKAGLSKDGIRMAKVSGTKFAFQTMSYYGKHNLSKKAINIQVIGDIIPMPTLYTQLN